MSPENSQSEIVSPERTQRLISRFEDWRKRHRIKQKDVAVELGMTPQQLNDILKGRTQPTGEQALHIQEMMSRKG
jgi:transcriptional regulator with XRE-family HTH domain